MLKKLKDLPMVYLLFLSAAFLGMALAWSFPLYSGHLSADMENAAPEQELEEEASELEQELENYDFDEIEEDFNQMEEDLDALEEELNNI